MMGAAGAAAGLALGGPALGQAPAIGSGATLTVSLWGGITEDAVRKFVEPEFTRLSGAKLAYDLGGEVVRFNKVLAQPNNPPADLIFTSDENVLTGHRRGIFMPARKKNVPNIADVYDWALTIKEFGTADTVPGVPYTLLANVLAYNPEKVKPAPTSWADLWRPEVQGKLDVTSPTNNSMVTFVIRAAELAGGGADNLDPGFKKLAQLRPIKTSVFWTDWAPLAKTGDVVMAMELDYYLEAMKDQGYPIDYVYPKEGAVGVPEYVSIVKGTKYPDLAELFLNLMIDPKVQSEFARTTYSGTVSSKADMPAQVVARCACGERTKQLRFFDPNLMMKLRPSVIERVNTEVVPAWGKT
jgi:putative spermidine/putrescine transport system substrate-binding protein